MKALIILVSFVAFFSIPVLAQTDTLENAILARAMKEQRSNYHSQVASNSSLNNGSLYKEGVYRTKKGETPYFLSDDWVEGSIFYSGQFFDKIDLQYDIVNNKIISHPFYSLIKMELVYERIERFSMQNHTFVRLKQISGDNNFYDELVDGNVKLYALRKLEVLEELSSGIVTHLFVNKTKYFILFENKLVEVKGRQGLLNLFPAKKAQLKKQIPAASGFRKDLEGALKASVLYYNNQVLK